jgi:hypothetical protein
MMTTKKTTKATEPTPDVEDVEGQGYLLDPVLASQMTHDRQRDMEKSTAERARQKEARPNKPNER